MTIKTIAICHKMLILLFQQLLDFLKSFPKMPAFQCKAPTFHSLV